MSGTAAFGGNKEIASADLSALQRDFEAIAIRARGVGAAQGGARRERRHCCECVDTKR